MHSSQWSSLSEAAKKACAETVVAPPFRSVLSALVKMKPSVSRGMKVEASEAQQLLMQGVFGGGGVGGVVSDGSGAPSGMLDAPPVLRRGISTIETAASDESKETPVFRIFTEAVHGFIDHDQTLLPNFDFDPTVVLQGVSLSSGKWCYELTLDLGGTAILGWAKHGFEASPSCGIAVGGCPSSWGLEGTTGRYWHDYELTDARPIEYEEDKEDDKAVDGPSSEKEE